VVEPFNSSYAPGPKDFDFDVNQISITPKRAQAVDFSSPYYTANQAVVALKDSDAADATSLADLADTQFGVQIGTTSLEAVEASIETSNEPQVFDTSNDVVTALKNEQVDAVVVDVPTAFFLTAVQVPQGTIVGQFSAPGGDEWGALLEKDSALTDCVSAAIDSLSESGELAEIEQTWISEKAKAPVLE
jgi:polar amino acid transport system substrate-binding protein